MTYINIVSNLKLHPQKGLVSKDCSGNGLEYIINKEIWMVLVRCIH